MGYRGIEGTSVGMNYELESPPEDMVCPELPNHGGYNFRSSSCKIKQTMPEYWKTCYPHCKGGANKKKHSEQQSSHTRSKRAAKLADKICQLYKSGKTINQIADRVFRSPKLVSLRLSEAGLISPDKTPTKKELVFNEWKLNPCLSDEYMREKYTLTRSTIESYRRDYRRQNNIVASTRGKVFEWLNENPEATVEDLMKRFILKEGTASSYHSQFHK